MTEIFYIKAGAAQPAYRAKAQDSDKNSVDITGATIYCTLTEHDGTVKINQQTTGIVVTNAAAGEFEYQWQAGDTDTPGSYEIEFKIVPLSGADFTLPIIPSEVARVIISA